MPIYTAADFATLLEARKAILNIGAPFSGKTRSLWTLVAYCKEKNLGPVHHIDLDQKVESLVDALRTEPEAKKLGLLDYLVVHRLAVKPRLTAAATKVTATKDLFEALQREINDFENHIDVTTGNWKSDFQCGAIVIDSLTRFNKICESWVAATLGHDFGSSGTDSRNDYTIVMNKVESTINGLKMCPCITEWLAHEMIVQSGLDGKITLLPNVAGKNTLAPTLAGMFNCTLYSFTQEDPTNKDKLKYVWQMHAKGQIKSAGVTSRSDLPLYVEQDYRKIL